MRDRRLFDATVVAEEPALDLALLDVGAPRLPAIAVGDSLRLRVGELVLAIGHPWGQPGVVTAGIISGLGEMRVRGSDRTSPYIRSNVMLAPGNSGGPLLSARGKVVGINSMIFGGDLAISIPSQVVDEWVLERTRRPIILDIEVQSVPLPHALLPDTYHERAAGLLITTPPREALCIGDVLLEVAGEPVEDVNALRRVLSRQAIGERVPLRLLRGGHLQAVEVDSEVLERRV